MKKELAGIKDDFNLIVTLKIELMKYLEFGTELNPLRKPCPRDMSA